MKEKAAKAFTEMTVNQEPGVNAAMAVPGEFLLADLIAEPDFLQECVRGNRYPKMMNFVFKMMDFE